MIHEKHIHVVATGGQGGALTAGLDHAITKSQKEAAAQGHHHEVVFGLHHDGVGSRNSIVGKKWSRDTNSGKKGELKVPESPLHPEEKLKFAKRLWPKAHMRLMHKSGIIDDLHGYHKKGYTHVHVHMDPSDAEKLRPNIMKAQRRGDIHPGLNIQIHDMKRISGTDGKPIKGTAVRAAIARGDKKAHRASVPAHADEEYIADHWHAMRKGMGLPDSIKENVVDEEFEEFLSEETLDDNLDFDFIEDDSVDLDPETSDASMLDVIAPELTDDENVEELEERKLSIPTRLKMGQRMRMMAKRYAKLRQIKATRMAPNDRLMYRARKAALMSIRKKVAGAQGTNYSSLGVAQKMSIDAMVTRRFGKNLPKVVDRIAKRLLGRVRKKETTRLAHARGQDHKTVKEHAGDTPNLIHPKHHGRRNPNSGITDDPLKHPIGSSKKKPYGDKELKLSNQFGIDDMSLEGGLTRKLFGKRDTVDEARKAAYDTEGNNEGDSHVIYQLRQASMARGTHKTVTWADGSKSVMHPAHAKAGLQAYAGMMSHPKPGIDRQRYVIALGKNENSYFDTIGLKEGKIQINPNNKNIIKKMNQNTIGSPEKWPVKASDANMPPTQGTGVGSVMGEEVELDAKLDSLLRSGLVNPKTISKYRSALRAGSKAESNPTHRKNLLALLDKMLNMTKSDPTLFNRTKQVAHDVQEELDMAFEALEFVSPANDRKAASASRVKPTPIKPPPRRTSTQPRSSAQKAAGSKVSIAHKTGRVRVGAKKVKGTVVREEFDIDEGIHDGKTPEHLRNLLALAKEARPGEAQVDFQKRRAEIVSAIDKKVKKGKMDPDMTIRESAYDSFLKKSIKTGCPIEVIEEVFLRGLDETDNETRAFERVNSFLAGGVAARLDADLDDCEPADISEGYFVTDYQHRRGKLIRVRRWKNTSDVERSQKRRGDLQEMHGEKAHELLTAAGYTHSDHEIKGKHEIHTYINNKHKTILVRHFKGKPETASISVDGMGMTQHKTLRDYLKEEGGAGEIGTDAAVRKYASETPGQNGNPFRPIKIEDEEKKDTGKSPKTWLEVSKALAGKREMKEGTALNQPTMTPEQIAKKHKVSVDLINAQLAMGIKIEKEHTKNSDVAREIALDHLGEKPDYYTRLKKMESKF